MKKLQQLSASIILIGLLSVFAFAGDGIMTTGKTDPPPPPPSAMAPTTEAEGTIHTGIAAPADPVTELVLSVLPSVLALF